MEAIHIHNIGYLHFLQLCNNSYYCVTTEQDIPDVEDLEPLHLESAQKWSGFEVTVSSSCQYTRLLGSAVNHYAPFTQC